MTLPPKILNLAWNQHASYWLGMQTERALPAQVSEFLQANGWKQRSGAAPYWVCQSASPWLSTWEKLYAVLAPSSDGISAAIIGGEEEPDAEQFSLNWKPADAMHATATSLWLAEALQRGDVLCYLQPVLSTAAQVVGYESFARVRGEGGKIIAGEAIVKAARALGVEFAIDRHLHVEAIKTFVSGNVSGYLFINFFPGFIQRPEVYLEGLSETARAYGIIAKHIVLDFTQSELPRDIVHLQKVTDYCRSKGYALALDDIESIGMVQKLAPDIRPDFIKLDKSLVMKCSRAEDKENIRQIVAQAHTVGALVIAEGVETEESFAAMKSLGVDMFQGYYFSAPVPVEEALKLKVKG